MLYQTLLITMICQCMVQGVEVESNQLLCPVMSDAYVRAMAVHPFILQSGACSVSPCILADTFTLYFWHWIR